MRSARPVKMMGLLSSRGQSVAGKLSLWTVIALCCASPVLWVVWTIATSPQAWRELWPDAFRWQMIGRTLTYNAAAAGLATAFALPIAMSLGLRRGRLSGALSVLVPLPVLLPTIVLTYGWGEVTRIALGSLRPQSWADLSRCILSLAAWLWPVPAMILSFSLRRLDPALREQALLEGAGRRFTLRLISPSLIVGFLAAWLLAAQEFAVYEPSGFSVISTEVRAVFETGAYGAGVYGQGNIGSGETVIDVSQSARTAAAIVTSVPLLLLIFAAFGGAVLAGRGAAFEESLHIAEPSPRLRASGWTMFLAIAIGAVLMLTPVLALIASHKTHFSVAKVWAEYSPQLLASGALAAATAAIAIVLAALAMLHRHRVATLIALLSFLIGGQIVAIALIRLFNRNFPEPLAWLTQVYDSPALAIVAYLSRFAWLPLAAGLLTWTPPWRALRDMVSLDGATPWETLRFVALPLAWPLLLASGVLVFSLSLTEVPATTLLQPAGTLVPMLMTWVHIQRFDAMIEASMLLLVIGSGLSVLAMLAVSTYARRARSLETRRLAGSLLPLESKRRQAGASSRLSVGLILILSVTFVGCSKRQTPEAVWLTAGRADGSVVYPRAIAYHPQRDSFFIIDRTARVQEFTAAGVFVHAWHMPEMAQGKPVGVSVAPDGNLWIPDTHYNRVLIYSPAGELLQQIGKNGTGDGEFILTTDIAFDTQGRAFVGEYGGNDRVQVFSLRGEFLFKFGHFGDEPDGFSRPQSLVIENDTLYVADACNHRISVWDLAGNHLRNIGAIGSEPGQFRFPYGLEMDHKGMLIVTEFGNNRVQRIDPVSGASVQQWGTAGRLPGELAYPWASACDAQGRTAVIDAGNNRVQIVRF